MSIVCLDLDPTVRYVDAWHDEEREAGQMRVKRGRPGASASGSRAVGQSGQGRGVELKGNGGLTGAGIGTRGRRDDLLKAACWCDRGTVLLTRAEVLACTTRACDRDRCVTLHATFLARQGGDAKGPLPK